MFYIDLGHGVSCCISCTRNHGFARHEAIDINQLGNAGMSTPQQLTQDSKPGPCEM